MALIPSESLNFPDSFRATVGWRATTKPVPPPADIPRRTEPPPDTNGEAKSAEVPADPSSSSRTAPNAAVEESGTPKDKAPEQPALSEETQPQLGNPTEDLKAVEPKPELEEAKKETKAEESHRELEQLKEEDKADEPKQMAQEQLVSKPAEPPKVAPAPPVETKPEEPRDVMPEPSPNIAPPAVGATLSGADAAALLSKIFFSPAAATTELDAIKSKAQPSEIPTDSVTADRAAEPKPSPPVAPVDSQPALEPTKELKKDPAKPVEPARKEFSINAQPAAPLGRDLSYDEQPNTVNIQTPAQTKQVLDLIAAAAARGVLKTESVSTQAPTIASPPAEKSVPEAATPVTTATKVAAPQEPGNISDEIAPGPERSVLNTPPVAAASLAATSPSPVTPVEKPSVKPVAAESSTPAPIAPAAAAPATAAPPTQETSQPPAKTPAKIRIQPRKLKARPIPQPAAESESADAEVAPEVTVPDAIAYAPVGKERAEPPASKPEPLPKPAYREWAESGMPLPQRADSAPELFTARDARNRWIRFGLGEFGALTVFVLLLSYVLSHKFPDPTLKLLIFILMFAVGALAIALPIMFIRNHPAQWQRRALNYRRDHANYF